MCSTVIIIDFTVTVQKNCNYTINKWIYYCDKYKVTYGHPGIYFNCFKSTSATFCAEANR